MTDNTDNEHDDEQEMAHDGRGRDADEPTEIPGSGWKDVALRVKDEFKADHVALSASGVAFHAFLAMIPLLVAAVSIYGLVADPSNVSKLVERLGSSVPQQLADLLEQQLKSVVESGSGALGVGALIGVAAALWSASSGMSHLMEAINIAYDEDVDDRPFWKKRGIAIASEPVTPRWLTRSAARRERDRAIPVIRRSSPIRGEWCPTDWVLNLHGLRC